VPKRLRRSAVDDAGEEVPPEANPGWNGGGVARSTSLTATCAALARRAPSVQLPLSSTIAPRTTHTISDSPVARRPPRSGMYPMTLCGYDGCQKDYEQIQKDAQELYQLAGDVDGLVEEQGVELQVIEKNVSSAQARVTRGADNLGNARDYQRQYRKKQMCCICMMLCPCFFND